MADPIPGLEAANVGGLSRVRGPVILPPGYTRARPCTCGATSIMWVKLVDALGEPKISRRTGKQGVMLVNLGAVRDGNLVLEGAGKARFIGSEWVPDSTDRFEPHYATCPHADRRRAGSRR